MGRNFGERRKKRRGQSKKPKIKVQKTTSLSKSDQKGVPQEPICTCREMVVYVPKNTEAQEQQKPKSSGSVQAQCNCLHTQLAHKHQERHRREGGRFFIDNDDGVDDDWEDVDDDDDWEDVDSEEDDLNDVQEMMLGHVIENVLLMRMMGISMTFSGGRVRMRQASMFPGLLLSSFMRH